MVSCSCLTGKGLPCKNTASHKTGDNPKFCHLHQKCLKPVPVDQPKIPIPKKQPKQVKEVPVDPKAPVINNQVKEELVKPKTPVKVKSPLKVPVKPQSPIKVKTPVKAKIPLKDKNQVPPLEVPTCYVNSAYMNRAGDRTSSVLYGKEQIHDKFVACQLEPASIALLETEIQTMRKRKDEIIAKIITYLQDDKDQNLVAKKLIINLPAAESYLITPQIHISKIEKYIQSVTQILNQMSALIKSTPVLSTLTSTLIELLINLITVVGQQDEVSGLFAFLKVIIPYVNTNPLLTPVVTWPQNHYTVLTSDEFKQLPTFLLMPKQDYNNSLQTALTKLSTGQLKAPSDHFAVVYSQSKSLALGQDTYYLVYDSSINQNGKLPVASIFAMAKSAIPSKKAIGLKAVAIPSSNEIRTLIENYINDVAKQNTNAFSLIGNHYFKTNDLFYKKTHFSADKKDIIIKKGALVYKGVLITALDRLKKMDDYYWVGFDLSTSNVYIPPPDIEHASDLKTLCDRSGHLGVYRVKEDVKLLNLGLPENVKKIMEKTKSDKTLGPQGKTVYQNIQEVLQVATINGQEVVTRNSYTDQDLLVGIWLCKQGYQGYSTERLIRSKNNNTKFHSEMMLCHPKDHLEYLGYYDVKGLKYHYCQQPYIDHNTNLTY